MAICGIVFCIFLLITIGAIFSAKSIGIPLISELFISIIFLIISLGGFLSFKERDTLKPKIPVSKSVDPEKPKGSSKVVPINNQTQLKDKRNDHYAVMQYECTKCKALFSTPSRKCPKCDGPMIGIKK